MLEDRLRALGWYIDHEKLEQISLIVEFDHVQLSAQRRGSSTAAPIVVRFSIGEVEALRQRAISRRGQAHGPRAVTRPSRLTALKSGQQVGLSLSQWLEQTHALSYQDLLRAIGNDLDQRGITTFRLDEQAEGVLLRIRAADGGPAIHEVLPLSRSELRTRVAAGIKRRGDGRRRAAVGS